MRALYVISTALSLGLAAAPARAECPEGDWFCDPAAESAPAQPAPAPPEQDAPEETEASPPAAEAPPQRRERVRRARVHLDPGPRPHPPRHRPRHRREFGLNLHLDGAIFGSESGMSRDAGMGGLGAAFRMRLHPMFALDIGVDFLGGRDFNGNARAEGVLSGNGLVYLNPRQRIELYLLGGLFTSRAEVDVRYLGGERVLPHDASYAYFGGQLGFGIEARLSRRVSASADVLGFVRERSRRYRFFEPDFVDPETHRTTNRSGGGLVRGGFTFYW